MSYTAISAADIASGKPGKPSIFTKIKDNLEYLYGVVGSTGVVGIPNASFEVDSDADGDPDSWYKSLYAGGSGTLYTVDPAHGGKAWSFTHPGGASNGGGYLDSAYIAVSEYFDYYLTWIHWATAAGMRNKVFLRFFDKAKTEVGAGSPLTVYDSISNPAVPTSLASLFTPPADACYAKIRLIGGYTDTDAAGTCYFDNLAMSLAMLSIGGAAAANTLRTTSSASYVKLKEIIVPVAGTVTTAFTLEPAGGSGSGYGRVYINGVAAGTERSVVTGSSDTFTQAFAVMPGDKVQVYACKGGAAQVSVSNFSVSAPVNAVTWHVNAVSVD